MSFKESVLSHFPNFQKSQDFSDELLAVGQVMEVTAGTILMNVGDYIRVIPFLMEGLLKIYREDAQGNEILLYYIKSGESCVISITAALKNEKSSIKAYVDEDSSLLAVPIQDFEKLLNKYNLLHNFTYDLFNLKYNQLIDSIDSLAFTDMRMRLMNYLTKVAQAKDTTEIEGLTHKKIAQDLSTSREVVSRLLNAFQKEGKIKLAHRKITLN